MGSLISGPKIPATPPAPPMAAPPTLANANNVATATNARGRAAAAAMANGTNPTGSQGVTSTPNTAYGTLLGGGNKSPGQ
jgi:hypothetical protein